MSLMVVLATAATWLGMPCSPANACGGTFCSAGPLSMPVDQTGENVLFALQDGVVEAHIQIQYDGDPDQFAWIVPVMAMPEITVGSDLLFEGLLSATTPTFTVDRTRENCGGGGGGGFGGGGCSDASRLAAGAFDDEWVDEPAVRGRDVVGSYEFAILDGGNAAGITRWLDDNGYARDPDAEPILEEYIDGGFMFVAFKLRPGAGTDQIHPVVVRYEGDEPCVPLRLTGIAAKEDMGVRVFFLGEHRVVPTNYRHVQINPLRIDWVQPGSNYEEVVTLAVDEGESRGHGFVTEYAGTSAVVDTSEIFSTNWNADAFIDIDASDLSDELREQGLLECASAQTCISGHPLIAALLARYLPAPSGVDPLDYYGCTECYAELGGPRWDRDGFAKALEERVLAPGRDALQLLGDHHYLTRMYTTISPVEMTEDPLFHENDKLPDVDNEWRATYVSNCEGPDRVELEDGRVIWFTADDDPPDFDAMPVTSSIAEVPADGAPMVLTDNAEEIDALLAASNAALRPEDTNGDGGCGCRSSRRMRGSETLLMLMALGLRARRRRVL